MAVVYLALDPKLDRLVALKLLRAGGGDMRKRFLREASVAGALQHPNIVTVYDVDEFNGQLFIAMEHVAGDTLAALLARKTRWPIARRLKLVLDLCNGLECAHAAGLVHRDIKPANLIVSRSSGTLKILDFGIARRAESSLTLTGAIIGTPNYMAPEQVEGETVDHRTDIFATGAVLYELLAYRKAFPGKAVHAVWQKILNGSPEPLASLIEGIDPALVAIVDRALQKSPADRYPDIKAMREDLAAATVGSGSGDDDVNPHTGSTLPSTPRPRAPSTAELSRRRAIRVAEHIRAAEAALSTGDWEGAAARADEASLIDADDDTVVALLERIREVREGAAIQEGLERGRELLQDGDLTAALGALEEAAGIRPDHDGIVALRREITEAAEARDRARELARLIEEHLAHARSASDAGDWQGAIRAADDALAHDPDHEEAGRIRTAAVAEAKKFEQRARDAVADAEARFARGEERAALAALEAFEPDSPVVDEALHTLQARFDAQTRQIQRDQAATIVRTPRPAPDTSEAPEKTEIIQPEPTVRLERASGGHAEVARPVPPVPPPVAREAPRESTEAAESTPSGISLLEQIRPMLPTGRTAVLAASGVAGLVLTVLLVSYLLRPANPSSYVVEPVAFLAELGTGVTLGAAPAPPSPQAGGGLGRGGANDTGSGGGGSGNFGATGGGTGDTTASDDALLARARNLGSTGFGGEHEAIGLLSGNSTGEARNLLQELRARHLATGNADLDRSLAAGDIPSALVVLGDLDGHGLSDATTATLRFVLELVESADSRLDAGEFGQAQRLISGANADVRGHPAVAALVGRIDTYFEAGRGQVRDAISRNAFGDAARALAVLTGDGLPSAEASALRSEILARAATRVAATARTDVAQAVGVMESLVAAGFPPADVRSQLGGTYDTLLTGIRGLAASDTTGAASVVSRLEEAGFGDPELRGIAEDIREPATPTVTPEAEARAAITELLTSYARAYSEMDSATLQRLWPGRSAPDFSQVESVTMTITPGNVVFNPQLTSAEVESQWDIVRQMKTGFAPETHTAQQWTVERQGDRWIIRGSSGGQPE